MSESITWTQLNWYALGTLLVQMAFLVAAVWFAKNILKIIKGFQEQLGAVLKHSASAGSAEHQETAAAKHSFAESPYWLTPSETGNAASSHPVESGPSLIVVSWHALGAASHRVGAWLNEPMGGSGVNPFRRMVRWLQTPAGTRPVAH